MVDRAGFEPATLQGTVVPFRISGSNRPAKRTIFSQHPCAVYQADLPAHKKTRSHERGLKWFSTQYTVALNETSLVSAPPVAVTTGCALSPENDSMRQSVGLRAEYRCSGQMRATDLAQTEEEMKEHVRFYRSKASPHSGFRTMVPGSDVGEPRNPSPVVWRRKNKRVKGGHEIEGYEIATHD